MFSLSSVNPPGVTIFVKINGFDLARESGVGWCWVYKPYGLVGQPYYLACHVRNAAKLASTWIASRASEPGQLIFGLSLFYLERRRAMTAVSGAEAAGPARAGVHQRDTTSRKRIRSDGFVFFAD